MHCIFCSKYLEAKEANNNRTQVKTLI